MEKCRICLNYRKNLHLLTHAEDGITFLVMISYVVNLKIIHVNNGMPDKICLLCRKKLREAYYFKMSIERSESILNETANLKKIYFNNINDIKTQVDIEIDSRHEIPHIINYSGDSLEDVNIITYNDTVIKKIKQDKENIQNKQIMVKEFLNSVEFGSDNECDDNHEVESAVAEYDHGIDSDSEYGTPLSTLKKMGKYCKRKEKKSNESESLIKQTLLKEPIKPVYLQDIRMARTEKIHKKRKRKTKTKSVNDLPSVCPYCAKIMTTRSLNVHILSHTSEKSFKCDQCPKTFFKVTDLNRHKKKQHTVSEKYKCDQCIASFTCKYALKSHIQSHSDEKNHVCAICNKRFKKKAHLNRHVWIHSIGNRPVQCEQCSMSFITMYNLRHHMRVHTGERPFKCEICSQPYSYRADFNRHCLKKHGVFLKRRQLHVMNEEILQREIAFMKDLALHANGVIKTDDIISTFSGPQGHLAYSQAIKAVEAKQIPVCF